MKRPLRSALVCILAAALLVSGLTVLAPAGRAVNVSDRLEERIGTTDMLGGGDFVLIRFGTDAAFGVLWGNDSNPNHVYVVAIKARYAGVAQVVDSSGRSIATNVPIKFLTLYAVRLQTLIEFRDANGNGLADYQRGYDGQNFTWFSELEDIPKRVDLRTNWTRGPIVRTNGTAERTWEFNLTATNLAYVGVNNTVQARGDNVLNLVQFTFHLRASLEEVDNATLANWRVTVDTAGTRPVVADVDRLDNLTFRGKVASYAMKWDQEIQGWDFEPGANRRLLLEFAAIVGNGFPRGIANWIDETYLARSNETGRARYRTASGNETLNDTAGDFAAPRALLSPFVEFGGNWTRIARFAWVAEGTVDGTQAPVLGQILAGRRILARGEGGGLFAGFVLLGGLSYPRGAIIVHDPETTLDVLAELSPPGAGEGTGLVAAIAVVSVAAVGLLAFFLRARRKREQPPPP